MRIECRHAPVCPGCPLLAKEPHEALAFKRERLVQAIERHAELALDVPETRAAEGTSSYRTRAKLVVGPEGGVGLFARGSHDVVDVPDCLVLAPVVKEVVDAIRLLVQGPNSPRALRPVDAGGALRAIDVREVRSPEQSVGALVTLVVDTRRGLPPAALAEAARTVKASAPSIVSVAVGRHGGRSPQVLGAEPEVVVGPKDVLDVVGVSGPPVVATSGGFVQAHRGQTERIHGDLLSALEERLGNLHGRRILDVFSGSGAIGARLAERGAELTLVEAFGPSLARAARAFERMGRSVRTHVGDAAEVVDRIVTAGERFDAVIVNPPRRGLLPALREALASSNPSVLCYVSCDPDTLARDLAHLARLGFVVDRLAPYDMMPLTEEVESLVVLVRGTPPAVRILHADPEFVVVDKPAHENVTPQEHGKSHLLARLDTMPHPTPVHRLDRGTSGACLVAHEPSHVAALQAALGSSDAEKEYLALCRGITRPKGSITRPLVEEGVSRDARTRYKRLAVVAGHSLLRVRIETGRTHQIRRHLASLGHPVIGDARYGDPATNRHFLERYTLDRPFLHAKRLTFSHPRTGQRLAVEAPLPGDLRTVLVRLGFEDDALARA